MNLKSVWKSSYSGLRRLIYYLRWRLAKLNWENIIISVFCFSFSAFIFYILCSTKFQALQPQNILSNLLTVNGVFSAILITYLFTRISWTKERKLELFEEAITHSQKITEFIRILHKLTRYYNVWYDQKATKDLFDHGKYKHLDFYEYKIYLSPVKETATSRLVSRLYAEKDFSEGVSATYLAMVSMVDDRKIEDFVYREEIHTDFQIKGIYKLNIVTRWLECGIIDTIWYWMNRDPNWINYSALRNDRELILAAANRVNSKYKKYELGNKLIEELSNEIGNYHLKQLYRNLKKMRIGITGLNLLITILILVSLISGVLVPFILLLVSPAYELFNLIVSLAASLNIGLIVFFIIKFPFLINRELKFVEWK